MIRTDRLIANDAADAESSASLLYIEDDRTSVTLIEAVLERFFPNVALLWATTGREGIRLVRSAHPDIVLLDMRLPDMSGLDVVRELSPEISRGQLRLVLLTAAPTSPEATKALLLGAVDCWAKPIDLRVLQRGLRAVLPAFCGDAPDTWTAPLAAPPSPQQTPPPMPRVR